jgi:hypothetical protein
MGVLESPSTLIVYATQEMSLRLLRKSMINGWNDKKSLQKASSVGAREVIFVMESE